MTIEGEIQQNEAFSHRAPCEEQPNQETTEFSHVNIPIACETAKKEDHNQILHEDITGFHFSDKMKRAGRLAIFVTIVAVLFAGRFSVPDNEVACVQDKVMEALGFANKFINTPGNETFRDFFLFFCSLMLDITFILTLGYWVLHGKSGRLPVTLAVFYGTRAIVQGLWTSPFPEGNYWYSPGIPSLVVPYGRQSDFFFSGHTGFLVICASEWHKLKMPKLRNFVICTAIYTILILLIYRTHYSIDVFTGLIFAEWCYCKADNHKEIIDKYWVHYITKLKNLFGSKSPQLSCLDIEKSRLTPQI
jgi:hypothetical protein